MGRPEDAVTFATEELALSQRLVDRLSADVGEPALVALLLGKTAQADERGIALTVTEDTHLPATSAAAAHLPLSPQEIVTVLGNLIDNAMDACDRDDPWVEVTVTSDESSPGAQDSSPVASPAQDTSPVASLAQDGVLIIRVADSGEGMDADAFGRAMQRGYSTKSDVTHHGLGLALVAQVVKRHGGTLTADVTYGSVVTVTVPVVTSSPRAPKEAR
jgi:sensor histidine kinase regulating citrate/malate metabolism